MTSAADTVTFSTLLQHAAWARRLAIELVRAEGADDLVQETWAAASLRPAPAGVPPRRWLAGVMRNLARFGARSALRRRQRERAVGAGVHGQAGASRPDEIVERLETQRLLAGLVLALPPLQRDVVLLRFHDELAPREIARRLGVPAGTVRSRLSLALGQLRDGLAASERGGAGDWRRALVVLAGGGVAAARPAAPARAAAVAGGTALAGAAGVVAALIAFTAAGVARPGPPAPGGLAAAGPAGAGRAGDGGPAARGPARPPRLMSVLPAAGGDAADRARLAARAEAAERYQVPLGAGPVRGPAGAKVTVLEFVDYQCPFTARAEAALARVLDRYGEEVRFQVIHRPLPFHPQAEQLARAALAAAEQGRFWQLHARLMGRTLERWTPERLERLAGAAGLDVARFRRDLDGAAVRAHAEVDEATASSLRVEGAPMFFVNGRLLVGAAAPAHMPAVIDEELARARLLDARGAGEEGLYNAAIAGGHQLLPPRPVSALAGAAPTASAALPAGGRGRPGFERLFEDGGSCGPLLDAPTALALGGGACPAAAGRPSAPPEGQRRASARPEGQRQASPWSLVTAGLEHYQRGFRHGEAVISSDAAGPDDYFAYQQAVAAGAYRGRRLRFRAEVKGEAIETWGGIWIRAVAADTSVITSARAAAPAAAPAGWHPVVVELTIPREAQAFSFGFALAGRGSLTVRSLAVEAAEAAGPGE
jgi:RNA polymerase sigma factor (sigma-70 family)